MILAANWSLLQLSHNSSCCKVRRNSDALIRVGRIHLSYFFNSDQSSDFNQPLLLASLYIGNSKAEAHSNGDRAGQAQQNNAIASSGGVINS